MDERCRCPVEVALGERGAKWWLSDLASDAVADRVQRTHCALQRHGASTAGQLLPDTAAVVSCSLDEVRAALENGGLAAGG